MEVDTIVIYESRGEGLVVGEFEIADRLCDTPRNIWDRTKEYAGISESDFFSYFEGRDKGVCHKSVTHLFLFFAFSQIRNL